MIMKKKKEKGKDIVFMGAKMSVGQVLETPLHTSVVSHKSVAFLQIEPSTNTSSLGQSKLSPRQYSSLSHNPVASRQIWVLGKYVLSGQVALTPLQYDAISQSPSASLQNVVEGMNSSSGHSSSMPLQYSAESQSDVAIRHIVVSFPVYSLELLLQDKCPKSTYYHKGRKRFHRYNNHQHHSLQRNNGK